MQILKAGPFRVGFLFENESAQELFSSRYKEWLIQEQPHYTITVSTRAALLPGYSPDIRYAVRGEDTSITSPCFRFSGSGSKRAGVLAISPEETQMVDSLENALRAVTQWLSVSRGSFVIHAAGVGKEGKCILLPASEGGGKSTIAELCFNAGCEVFGDDLVMVAPGRPDEMMLYGLPFRGETAVSHFETGPSRIAGLLFIMKGPGSELRLLSQSEAAGRIMSNTPFLKNAPSLMLEKVLACSVGLINIPCSQFCYSLESSPETVILEHLHG